jgi:hypothetical protein
MTENDCSDTSDDTDERRARGRRRLDDPRLDVRLLGVVGFLSLLFRRLRDVLARRVPVERQLVFCSVSLSFFIVADDGTCCREGMALERAIRRIISLV